MYSYIIAKVISINKKSITIETENKIGYVINVSDPNIFEQKSQVKIYLYLHSNLTNKNAINQEFYGFKEHSQKKCF